MQQPQQADAEDQEADPLHQLEKADENNPQIALTLLRAFSHCPQNRMSSMETRLKDLRGIGKKMLEDFDKLGIRFGPAAQVAGRPEAL